MCPIQDAISGKRDWLEQQNSQIQFDNGKIKGENGMRLIGVYDYTVLLTYGSLFSAVFGMIQASRNKFTMAVICLFISGFCDAFDGIVARSKKDRTEDEKAFGIQLDSLCDVIAFGVFPALLCYFMGVDGVMGLLLACLFCMCAVARLAFFNVLEAKRQQVESGCNRFYRGLPVTSISLIFPVVYLLKLVLPGGLFVGVLHGMLLIVGFLFILDFQVPKPDWLKVLAKLGLTRK